MKYKVVTKIVLTSQNTYIIEANDAEEVWINKEAYNIQPIGESEKTSRTEAILSCELMD